VQLPAHLYMPSMYVVSYDWLSQSPDLYAACACRLQMQLAGNETAWQSSGAARMSSAGLAE
jgi:hypothetical protein